MENEYSSLITNLGGQVYQKAEPFRETGEDRMVNVVSNIPKNYTPTTYELSGNTLVFTLSSELKNLYPNSTARLGDKTVSIQTLESPLEIKVGETVDIDINWGDRYAETFTIYNPKKEVEPGPEPPHPEILDYFWITPEEDAKIIVKFGNFSYCDYSIDQVLWKSLWDDDLIIPANTKIYLRANTINEHQWSFSVTKNNSENARFNVGGNIMSLVYSENFVKNTEFPAQDYSFGWFFTETSVVDASELVLPANHLTAECYAGMFSSCTSLTAAPELPAMNLASRCYYNMFSYCTSLTEAPELPATTLANNCYERMFESCTALTTAPELPAMTLAEDCYQYVFMNCTSLIEAPELPATTLANYCYRGMFDGCTSLVNAPSILPATTLAESCYSGMFSGCSSLNSAPELMGTESVSRCYIAMFIGCTSLSSVIIHIEGIWNTADSTNWLANVAPSGTLYNLGEATFYPVHYDDPSGCPTGWTIETELPQE